MSQTRINIKGTSFGLIIDLGPGDWNGLLIELAAQLEQSPAFFKGGRVALHVGRRQLTSRQLKHVGELLRAHRMSLWAVIGDSDETQKTATSLGLETTLARPKATGPSDKETGKATAEEHGAILVRRTLRSGQSVRYPRHVVVIGDVNPGAEIIAGGDVVVWGRIRGTIHAGAGGNDQAVVCALSLSPTQLRIGGHIARPPSDEPSRHGGHSRSSQEVQGAAPEVASVQNGQIVVEPWAT